MPSYITFVNRSDHPVISIYSEDFIIADDILKNSRSKEYSFESGSVRLSVRENRNKEFMDLWLSMYPMRSYDLIIKNNGAYLK